LRLQRHGAELSPEDILITHGSQQGLELLFRLLVNETDRVALEQPTFPGAMGLAELHGAKVLGIPMLADGMNLDFLYDRVKRVSKQHCPKFVYTIPAFHNPTGTTTAQPHRERLLEICERFGLPLVEDGFQEEFTFFDKVVQPIKAMDRRGLVFYLGSFSKIFVPGLRLGWIAARRDVIRQLSCLKYASDISCSPIVQAALESYCASGDYELHLRRMNRVLSARLRRAVEVLHAELPSKRAALQTPSGGYLLWLRVQAKISERRLVEVLREHRVSAAPGSLFYVGQAPQLSLRVSISSLNDAEIAEGARRLGQALRTL
jgi:DNA-binding transcriptional MocR family regulator